MVEGEEACFAEMGPGSWIVLKLSRNWSCEDPYLFEQRVA